VLRSVPSPPIRNTSPASPSPSESHAPPADRARSIGVVSKAATNAPTTVPSTTSGVPTNASAWPRAGTKGAKSVRDSVPATAVARARRKSVPSRESEKAPSSRLVWNTGVLATSYTTNPSLARTRRRSAMPCSAAAAARRGCQRVCASANAPSATRAGAGDILCLQPLRAPRGRQADRVVERRPVIGERRVPLFEMGGERGALRRQRRRVDARVALAGARRLREVEQRLRHLTVGRQPLQAVFESGPFGSRGRFGAGADGVEVRRRGACRERLAVTCADLGEPEQRGDHHRRGHGDESPTSHRPTRHRSLGARVTRHEAPHHRRRPHRPPRPPPPPAPRDRSPTPVRRPPGARR
jgi:hypothetical protein